MRAVLAGMGDAPFLYRCPTTGYRVQGFVAEEVPAERDIYEAVTCIACQRVHMVLSIHDRLGATSLRTVYLRQQFTQHVRRVGQNTGE